MGGPVDDDLAVAVIDRAGVDPGAQDRSRHRRGCKRTSVAASAGSATTAEGATTRRATTPEEAATRTATGATTRDRARTPTRRGQGPHARLVPVPANPTSAGGAARTVMTTPRIGQRITGRRIPATMPARVQPPSATTSLRAALARHTRIAAIHKRPTVSTGRTATVTTSATQRVALPAGATPAATTGTDQHDPPTHTSASRNHRQ